MRFNIQVRGEYALAVSPSCPREDSFVYTPVHLLNDVTAILMMYVILCLAGYGVFTDKAFHLVYGEYHSSLDLAD